MRNLQEYLVATEPRSLKRVNLDIVEEQGLGFVKINARELTAPIEKSIEMKSRIALPDKVNRFVSYIDYSVARTAPFHLLAIGEEFKVNALHSRLTQLTDGHAILVTTLTNGRSSFRISGRDTLEYLYGLMLLDFHPRSFKPGITATTLIGETHCFIQCLDEAPIYRLVIDQAHADYVWRLMVQNIEGLKD